jgi:hypothetical protein
MPVNRSFFVCSFSSSAKQRKACYSYRLHLMFSGARLQNNTYCASLCCCQHFGTILFASGSMHAEICRKQPNTNRTNIHLCYPTFLRAVHAENQHPCVILPCTYMQHALVSKDAPVLPKCLPKLPLRARCIIIFAVCEVYCIKKIRTICLVDVFFSLARLG